MTVPDYVVEEVARQGHNVRTLDGIERIGWMLDAWCSAILLAGNQKPDLQVIEKLGQQVERFKNTDGFRNGDVRVGLKICPPHERVISLLQILLEQYDELAPVQFYKEFELIHPFFDGNGRVGKILLNWKNGTLLSPYFPPNNLWGIDILNP